MEGRTSSESIIARQPASFKLMPSGVGFYSLSHQNSSQNSNIKTTVVPKNKENVAPNQSMGTAFYIGGAHHFASSPKVSTQLSCPSPIHLQPIYHEKPIQQEVVPVSVPAAIQMEYKEETVETHKSPEISDKQLPPGPFRAGKWNTDEDDMLRAAVAKFGSADWALVASEVYGRSTIQCRDRWTLYLADGLNTGDLTPEEVVLMKKLLPAFVRNRKKPWAKLAQSFPNRTGTILKNAWKRWENSQKPKRNGSSSQIIRHRKSECLLDIEDGDLDLLADTQSPQTPRHEEDREELILRLKIPCGFAALSSEGLRTPQRSAPGPLVLRSFPNSAKTPGKMSLIPLASEIDPLLSFSSPNTSITDSSTTFNSVSVSSRQSLGDGLFSPPRGLQAHVTSDMQQMRSNAYPHTPGRFQSQTSRPGLFTPQRQAYASARPALTPLPRPTHAAPYLDSVLASTPARTANLNSSFRAGTGLFSPQPLWRDFDSSLFESLDSSTTRFPHQQQPIQSHADSDLHSSVMLSELPTTNASISEFNPTHPNHSPWIFPDPQPGQNPWAV